MTSVICESDHQELKRLEGIISKGKKAFSEVGAALYEIRESKLYRSTHKTFEAYVADRWEFSKSRARQLIEAAAVIENVYNCNQTQPILPSSEGVARELAKLPAEEQSEVWEEVIKTTASPTARIVKAVVEKRKEAEPACVPKTVAPAEPFASQQDFAATIHAAATHVDKLVHTVRELAEQEGGVWLDTTTIEMNAKALKAEIRSAAFWIVCPACDGQGCKECRKHGWLSKSRKPFLTTAMVAKMEAAK